MPPRKIAPSIRFGVWFKVSVSFRVGGGQPDNCPKENWPPGRVRVWVRVSFGVGGGNFPRWQLS